MAKTACFVTLLMCFYTSCSTAEPLYGDLMGKAEFDCAVGFRCPEESSPGAQVLRRLTGLSQAQCELHCTVANCIAFSYSANDNYSCSLLSKPCGAEQLEFIGGFNRYCAIRCPSAPTCGGCVVNSKSSLRTSSGLSVSEASYSCLETAKSIVGPSSLSCNSSTTTWAPPPKCADSRKSSLSSSQALEEPQTVGAALQPSFDCQDNWFCPVNPRHNQLIERRSVANLDACKADCATLRDCVAFNFHADGAVRTCALLRKGCHLDMLRQPKSTMARVAVQHCAKSCPSPTCRQCLQVLRSEFDHSLTIRTTKAEFSCGSGQRLVGPEKLVCDTQHFTWGTQVPSCPEITRSTSE